MSLWSTKIYDFIQEPRRYTDELQDPKSKNFYLVFKLKLTNYIGPPAQILVAALDIYKKISKVVLLTTYKYINFIYSMQRIDNTNIFGGQLMTRDCAPGGQMMVGPKRRR